MRWVHSLLLACSHLCLFLVTCLVDRVQHSSKSSSHHIPLLSGPAGFFPAEDTSTGKFPARIASIPPNPNVQLLPRNAYCRITAPTNRPNLRYCVGICAPLFSRLKQSSQCKLVTVYEKNIIYKELLHHKYTRSAYGCISVRISLMMLVDHLGCQLMVSGADCCWLLLAAGGHWTRTMPSGLVLLSPSMDEEMGWCSASRSAISATFRSVTYCGCIWCINWTGN